MTTPPLPAPAPRPAQLPASLIQLVDDLSRELPEAERYRRLLRAMRDLLPGDAAALLRLDNEWLVPLAVDGLSEDTLGRRFGIREHPRLQQILQATGTTRFGVDCELPDPYDGLIEGHPGKLRVHDCMGCPLRLDDKPWGLLTLDALDSGRFTQHHSELMQTFASLAAASVKVVERIAKLSRRAEDEHDRAETYRMAAAPSPRTLIGASAAHKRMLEEIALVGGSDLTVLVLGETGVGKELVAQALHAASTRSARPLVSINCAALPESLAESELFGHVRGAFSGSVGDRRGKFELADGGTLFLDEVGELPRLVQAKLLRVAQSGQLQRVGSDFEHHVDVRIIAATNRDLAEEVRAGRFRADLYHRLSVFPLRVPPLRERGRDVLLLAGFFLEQNRSRLGLRHLRLAADAQAALLCYGWPGNVRELEHLIGRGTLKALGKLDERPRILSLTAAELDLPTQAIHEESSDAVPRVALKDGSKEVLAAGGLRHAVEAFERQIITASLLRNGQSWVRSARELGLHCANLRRLAKRLGIVTA